MSGRHGAVDISRRKERERIWLLSTLSCRHETRKMQPRRHRAREEDWEVGWPGWQRGSMAAWEHGQHAWLAQLQAQEGGSPSIARCCKMTTFPQVARRRMPSHKQDSQVQIDLAPSLPPSRVNKARLESSCCVPPPHLGPVAFSCPTLSSWGKHTRHQPKPTHDWENWENEPSTASERQGQKTDEAHQDQTASPHSPQQAHTALASGLQDRPSRQVRPRLKPDAQKRTAVCRGQLQG